MPLKCCVRACACVMNLYAYATFCYDQLRFKHWWIAGVGSAGIIRLGSVCIREPQNVARLGTELQGCQSSWQRCRKTAQVSLPYQLIYWLLLFKFIDVRYQAKACM